MVSNSIPVTVNATPSAPVITAGTSTTFCSGDSVVLTSSGTGNKLWSNGQNGNTLVVKGSGVLSVRAYALGCTSQVSNSIAVLVNPIPSTPVLTAGSATTFCSGDSVKITSNTGTGMIWSTGQSGVNQIVVKDSLNVYAWVSQYGCVSAISNTINVVAKPIPVSLSITTSRTPGFCLGDSVYLSASGSGPWIWNNGDTTSGFWVKNSGTYSVITEVNGCYSPISNIVQVNANNVPIAPVITTSNNIFCQNDSIVIRSNVGTGMQWSTGETGDSIVVKGSAQIFGYVIDQGCPSNFSNIIVTQVTPSPASPVITAQGNTVFCSGDSVVLQSNVNQGLTWSSGDTSTSLVITSSGAYSAKVYQAGCWSLPSNLIQIKVNAIPSIPVISISGNSTFCSGDSVALFTQYGSGILWSNGKSDSVIYSTKSENITAIVVINGCSSNLSSPVQTVVKPVPSTPIISIKGSATACDGDSIELNSSNLLGNYWSNGDTSNTIFVKKSGSYTVKSMSNGCYSSNSLSALITINPKPAKPLIQINGARSICFGDSVILSSSAIMGNQWNRGDTTNNIVVKNSGLFTVVAQALGCVSDTSLPVQITVNPIPSKPVISQVGDTLVSSANSGNQWYEWGVGAIVGATFQKFLPVKSGYFYVIVNEFGCSSTPSDSIHLIRTAAHDIVQNKLNVYPNPSNTWVVVAIAKPVNDGIIRVYESSGKLVQTWKPLHGQVEMQISTEHLAQGVYWISWENNHEKLIRKLIIQH